LTATDASGGIQMCVSNSNKLHFLVDLRGDEELDAG